MRRRWPFKFFRIGQTAPYRPVRWADGKRRRGWQVRNTLVPTIAGLVLGAAVFVGFSGCQSSGPTQTASLTQAAAPAGISVRVIDGDTLEVTSTGERIRLENIDTPETGSRARCAAERDVGNRASQAARELTSTGVVTIRRTGRTDQYGRTIGFVQVDGRDMGEILIERGLARPWRGRREQWCAADGSLLPAR